MEQFLINGEALCASTEATLEVEQYLTENYLFRRNELSGKVEFATKAEDGHEPEFRPLSEEAFNGLVVRAKHEGIGGKRSPKTDIREYVYSDLIPLFNPIQDYLGHLPKWDGKNRVAELFGHIPGISSEQLNMLTIWLRSVVAHWRQMDRLHGNECVPTLIGAQGIGKTVFFRRLLPPHLQSLFLERLRMTNDFSKDMALTNNLLVNLDELASIKPSQQAELKHILSMNRVNGRRIFQSTQDDLPRYASFVATTNERHPLCDPTGSRRFICITIPEGMKIDNASPIDHDQLYAQLMYELDEVKSPYWFSDEEVERLQQMNLGYMATKDMVEMVEVCFRKPEEGEHYEQMNPKMLLEVVNREYGIEKDHTARINLGKAMHELGFDSTKRSNVPFYKVVLLKVA